MNPALRKFLSVDYSSEKIPTDVFTDRISHYEALLLFNDFIECCNGDGLSLSNARNSALHSFCSRYDLDLQRALFNFFQEYKPHWQCVREFSRQNMKTFIAKLSNSNFFLQGDFNPSLTAPKFKIVTVHHEPEKTAAVQKKRAPCSIHRLKDSCLKSMSPIPLCHGCTVALHIAIKKGVITKDSAREDIMLYLKNRQKEKILRIERGRKVSLRRIPV